MNYKTFDIFEGKKKEVDLTKPVDMFPDQFCGLMIGKPGSGKSKLIELMLKSEKAFYKKFDLTLFIAPYSIGGLNLKEDRKHESLNIDWIKGRINHFSAKKPINKVLLIIDDMVSSINKDQNQPEIIDLFFNRRKMFGEQTEINILVTTQKYKMFPAKYRSSLQFIIFFNIPKEDYEQIAGEHLYTSQLSLKPILKAHFQVYEHNFVFIRLDKSQLFLNFNKQI